MIKHVVDFVDDCGADPTGTNDITPALNLAYTLISTLGSVGNFLQPNTLLPACSVELYIPPGLYKIASQPNTWDMGSVGTSLRITGGGDATVLSAACGEEAVMWEFANVQGELSFSDFAVQGTTGLASSDASYGFLITGNTTGFVTCTRLHFDYFCPNNSCIATGAILGGLRVEQCRFTAVLASNGAIWTQAAASLVVRDCVFLNAGNLNGTVRTPTFAPDNTWIFAYSSAAIGSDLQTHDIDIENCLFDSIAAYCVSVNESTSDPIVARARVTGCLHNPSTALNANAKAYSFSNVALVEIDGVINSGYDTLSTAEFIDLAGVQTCRIRGVVINSSASSNKIVADSTSGYLLIEDSPSMIVSLISSKAAYTRVTNNDVCLTSLSTTGGATTYTGSGSVGPLGDQLEVSGILTSNATISLPNISGLELTIFNNTTGSYTVTIEASGGTGFAIAQGKRAIGYVNGSTTFVRVTPDT